MWGELLAERSDPMLRSFEIADAQGRVLLVLPFREVLERARKPIGRMPEQVWSAHVLLERTRALATSLREEIMAAQQAIETAQKSMQETRRVLDRLPGNPLINPETGGVGEFSETGTR